jgi:hypothetical protein
MLVHVLAAVAELLWQQMLADAAASSKSKISLRIY